jgi:transcriptional regulator with XRE-family HTH domain
MASVGKHIRYLRTARGLTQEQLAEKLFVTRQTVSAWETGRAQPDLETLERIAAALGAEVTEVIYGASRPQALGPLKCRWAMIGGIITIIIVFIFIILFKNGTYGAWRYGLSSQLSSADYALSYSEVPGSWSVELDLVDLNSNAGKILYEDESGCRILLDAVDEYEGAYGCGSLIRRMRMERRDAGIGCQLTRRKPLRQGSSLPLRQTGSGADGFWAWETSVSMTAAMDGADYPCTLAGESSLIYKNGNQFGFHLNPRRPDWEPVEIDGLEQITVTVSGLARLSTQRVARSWEIV